jgi:hypothetical protein
LELLLGLRLTKEQAKKLVIGDDLTTEERELLLEVLLNREEALAFDWTYYGIIYLEVALL